MFSCIYNLSNYKQFAAKCKADFVNFNDIYHLISIYTFITTKLFCFFFCHDINCKIPTHHGRGGIIHLRIVHDNVNWLHGKDLYRYEGQTGEQIIFVDVAISSEILPSDY